MLVHKLFLALDPLLHPPPPRARGGVFCGLSCRLVYVAGGSPWWFACRRDVLARIPGKVSHGAGGDVRNTKCSNDKLDMRGCSPPGQTQPITVAQHRTPFVPFCLPCCDFYCGSQEASPTIATGPGSGVPVRWGCTAGVCTAGVCTVYGVL